jgi:hypothetical protein
MHAAQFSLKKKVNDMIIDFPDILHNSVFDLKQRITDGNLPLSSDKKPSQLGLISRTGPYLQSLEPRD